MGDSENLDPTRDDDDMVKKIVFQNAIEAAGWVENRDAADKIARLLPILIEEVRELNKDLPPLSHGSSWAQSWWSFAGIVALIGVVFLATYVPLNTRIGKLELKTVPVITTPSATTTSTSTTTSTAVARPGTTVIGNNGSTSRPTTSVDMSPSSATASTTTVPRTSTTTQRTATTSVTVLGCPRPPIC